MVFLLLQLVLYVEIVRIGFVFGQWHTMKNEGEGEISRYSFKPVGRDGCWLVGWWRMVDYIIVLYI